MGDRNCNRRLLRYTMRQALVQLIGQILSIETWTEDNGGYAFRAVVLLSKEFVDEFEHLLTNLFGDYERDEVAVAGHDSRRLVLVRGRNPTWSTEIGFVMVKARRVLKNGEWVNELEFIKQ